MSYESRIYVGVVRNGDDYFSEIAKFQIGKIDYTGAFHRLIGMSKDVDDLCLYADDGDTEITIDKYGEKLKELPLDDVIKALGKDKERYRRIPPVIEFLRVIKVQKEFGVWGYEDDVNIKVLHFGY